MEMNKSKLVETLRKERQTWDALLAEVARHGMTEPGLAGHWSAKDLIAHVTWYERETASMIEQRALVGSDLWELPQDERNIPIYEEYKDRQLEEILVEARNIFNRLVQAVESLSEEELVDASHFREMPEEWTPWKVIASNSYEHYHQHIPGVRAWLDELDKVY
jgi:hypothetical protein